MSDDGINAIDSELLRTLIDETVDRAVKNVRTPRLLPGTVIHDAGVNPDQNVEVLVDGDLEPITVTSIIGAVSDGQRVMVLFYPPSGAVIIGVIGGANYLRIMNSDRTAPVFEVTNGVGGFPLTSATWQPNYETAAQNAQGYRLSGDGAGFATSLWTCVLSLVTSTIHWEFDVMPDATWTSGEVAISALTLNARGSGFEITTVIAAGLDNSTPQNIQGDLEIPTSIIVGSDDVVGANARLRVYARRTGGTGSVGIAPLIPVWCV